jgi:hypothetical protein
MIIAIQTAFDFDTTVSDGGALCGLIAGAAYSHPAAVVSPAVAGDPARTETLPRNTAARTSR